MSLDGIADNGIGAGGSVIGATGGEAAGDDFAANLGLASDAIAMSPPGKGTEQRELDMARLADDVYQTNATPPPGWRVASEADLKNINLTPADLTISDTGFRARVYVAGSGENTDYVVAFKGTDFSSRIDWINNVRQALGGNSPYYDQAIRIGRETAFADADIEFVGHSLGGGLASAAAIASGFDASTYNAAGLSNNTINKAIASNPCGDAPGHVTAYYVPGEALNVIQEDHSSLFKFDWLGKLAPDAYGNQVALEVDEPANSDGSTGLFARHGRDWVLSGIEAGDQ
ncbi:MAG: Mbeg1-like protein [Pseudomonadota bacterium]